jgi:predicted phage terminase large subunit-like protein
MNKTEAIQVLFEAARRKARESLINFTRYTMPGFTDTWFHKSFYRQLERFATGEASKLMVWVPPQHGKTEAATRRMTAYLLGKDPSLKIAIVSYNSPMARKFNREIQRIIDLPEYKELFPKTKLNEKNVVTVTGSWLRNADECETVGFGGGFKTVGVGGALTGSRVDVLIIDDVYKDAQDAWSTTVRSNIADWYDTVAETRLHNDSKQLIVFTRWHEDDLAGRILKHQDGWEIVKYEALKEGEPTEADPRRPGEALWPERHDANRLLDRREKNPYAFEALYQQNPSPKGGNYIRGDWFNIVSEKLIPEAIKWDMWIDGAYTKSTNNDPSGIMVAGMHENKLYIRHFAEAYMEMPELLNMVSGLASLHGVDKGSRVFIEPKASGKTLYQLLRQQGMNAVEITGPLVSQGKEARIHTAVPSANAGAIDLVEGSWNKAFIHQLEAFPGAKHDEAVDLIGYAVDHYFINKQQKNFVI